MLTWHVNRHSALVADLKDSARRLTRMLIEAGQVRPRPGHCERCGNPPPEGRVIECHHLDYPRPAAIAYLCPPCHRAAHRTIPWQQLWDSADHGARQRQLEDAR